MTNLDYLYNPDAAKPSFEKNYFVDKKLGFQVIEHGTILPYKSTPLGGLKGALGGIVDNKGKFIRGSFVQPLYENKGYTPESIQHSSKTVIYIGYFFPVWGHVITDNICHLWFLKSDFFKKAFKNCPLVYIKFWGVNIKEQKNFWRLLEILEVGVDKFQEITQPTQFDKIILPDASINAKAYFTNEYRETIDIVRNFALKNRMPISSKKIYYFHGRRQIGEEQLAEYFKSKGYEIISPEKLTLEEQLNLLINCESFASTVGSASHNSVFLRDGIETIFIPRVKELLFSSYQQILNQVNSVNANYVDSSLSLFKARNGPFCYIISDKLKKFFGDKFNGCEEENFKVFLRYVKDSLSKGLAVNLREKQYYDSFLQNFMTQLKQREDLIKAYDMPSHWEEFRLPLTYQTHVHKRGWRDGWKNGNDISNDIEQKLDVQAVKINFPNHNVYYSVYYNDAEGWSEEVSNGEMAGTTGKSKSIYGMSVWLDEAGSKEFDILYRMHKFDGTWTPWAKNGEIIYSYGQKLNAIQIKLEGKSDATKA